MTSEVPATQTRALGFWMCTALVVGNTIGIGVFMMPTTLAPYGLNAISGWLITLVGFLFLAGVFAGLSRVFPKDGGPYAYMLRAFGPGVAFMVIWCYWISVWVTNATIAIGVVSYLSKLVPAVDSNPFFPPVTALSLVWLFVILNWRGARAVGRTQVITTALKLIPLTAIILIFVWIAISSPATLTQHVPTTPMTLSNIKDASAISMFAMLGIECATIPAGRVLNPERTIPRATVVGTILTALVYIVASVAPMLLIPQAELAASSAPFADLLTKLLGGGYGEILALFIIVSGLGALNGWTLVAGELAQQFSQHGTFPRILGKENKYGAPALAFILAGITASVVLLLNYSKSTAKSFEFLSIVVTAANMPLYLTCALAVVVLRSRGEIGTPERPERLFFAAALCALIFCGWVFWSVGATPLLYALGLALVGIPVYWSMVMSRRRTAVTSSVA
jgi:APA family basic amino acid/polyamine antiporter